VNCQLPGDYLETISNLDSARYINGLKIWEDEDSMVQGLFKFTHGLKNNHIQKLKRKFWNEKKKVRIRFTHLISDVLHSSDF